MNKQVDDDVICPVCKNGAWGFTNESYYDMYTVRCPHCNKEYDYGSRQDFIDGVSFISFEKI